MTKPRNNSSKFRTKKATKKKENRRSQRKESGLALNPNVQKVRVRKRTGWRKLRLAIISLIWVILISIGGFAYIAHDLPKIDNLQGPKSRANLILSAEDGSPLGSFGVNWGNFVSIDQISPLLLQAVIAIEDARYYQHGGMDIFGLARAVWKNIISNSIREGGSTITQQLAKLAFLTPEKTFKRKIQELVLAFQLEKRFSKDDILTLYLNRVYLGSGNYGVDAAVRSYFNKLPYNLSLSEAALIAGLLKAPSRFSPRRNLRGAHKRATLVLDRMTSSGFITYKDAAQAKSNPASLFLEEDTHPQNSINYGYFIDWIKSQLPSYIGSKSSVLKVQTTLDENIQKAAELALIQGLLKNSNQSVKQGAIVVLSPDGAVLAMVGGKNYRKSQFNRASQALRQPGSAFKTLVYLAGIEAGLKTNDIFEDRPVEIEGWNPQNYDGKYIGSITFSDAFALSINSVAVQIGQMVGTKNIVKMAKRLGITSNLPTDASISLGTGEISLLELTAAYATLSNGGILALPHGIKNVKNRGGDTLYTRHGSGGGRVISSDVITTIKSLLSKAVTKGTGNNAQLPIQFGKTYGKTGTSQNYRDAWFIGFSNNLVTGVWIGNDDNSPMPSIMGGGLPATIWRDFMLEVFG